MVCVWLALEIQTFSIIQKENHVIGELKKERKIGMPRHRTIDLVVVPKAVRYNLWRRGLPGNSAFH